jgi:FG-GAP-like repeat/FG-GAP repeat
VSLVRRALVLVLPVALMIALPAVASASVSFTPRRDLALPISQRGTRAGDFNGDGRQDIAVADTRGFVCILRGTGSGSFLASSPRHSPGARCVLAGQQPTVLATGDLNGDGRDDLVVGSALSTKVAVWLSTPWSVLTPRDFDVGKTPTGAAIGDFNRDGVPDLAVTKDGSSEVSVLVGTGSGHFSPETVLAGPEFPRELAIADFNEDGEQDLAVADFGGGVSIFLGHGDGSFAPEVKYAAGMGPVGLAVADYNSDGHQDLAVSCVYTGVALLLGDGSGAFAAPANFTAGYEPTGIAAADFDGDGHQDVAVVNAYPDTDVDVLLGDGSGELATPISILPRGDAMGFAAGNFNSDSLPDLVIFETSAAWDLHWNGLSVLLNASSPDSRQVVARAANLRTRFSPFASKKAHSSRPSSVAGSPQNHHSRPMRHQFRVARN